MEDIIEEFGSGFLELPGHFFLLDSGMKIWGMVELFTNLCGSF